MENLNFGPILILLIFILLPLISRVLHRFGSRPVRQIPAANPATDIPRGRQIASTPAPSSHPSPKRDREAQVRSVPAPIARRRFAKKSLLGNRRDLRRAFIIMAVLGPCRAFDPGD
jgi:hypothetical protein